MQHVWIKVTRVDEESPLFIQRGEQAPLFRPSTLGVSAIQLTPVAGQKYLVEVLHRLSVLNPWIHEAQSTQ